MFALKTLSCAFQVFGCFFLSCVQVHSFSRTFTKKRRRKKETFYALNSTHWAGNTRHYSQIGISSLISFRPKTEDVNSFCSFVLCDYFSEVASSGKMIVFFRNLIRCFMCHTLLIGEKLCVVSFCTAFEEGFKCTVSKRKTTLIPRRETLSVPLFMLLK